MIKIYLDSIPHGQRSKAVKEVAQGMGIHPATLHRRLARKYGKKKRLERRTRIPQELIDKVGVLKAESRTYGRNEREITTADAIDLLEQAGQVPAGLLTTSTVDRRLRKSGHRDEKPAVRYECRFANEAHQIDFSRAEYFEVVDFDKQAGDYLLMSGEKGLYYKNKEENKKLRLWLAQVVDEYSRVRLVRYFVAAGESTLMGLQMLHYVWRRQPDTHPLIYLPYFLRTDNGSFSGSPETKSMLRRLEIGWTPSKPHNSRSMGKVERGWRTWWSWELKQAIAIRKKGVLYLKELNDMAFANCVAELDKKHPGVNMDGRRGDLYRQSLASAVQSQRRVDGDIVDLATRVVERTVGMDCLVRYDNRFYQAPGEFAGRRIRVVMAPNGKMKGESNDLGKSFELNLFQPLAFGEYKSHPDTYRERMGKQYDDSLLDGAKPDATPKPAAAANQFFLPANETTVEAKTPFAKEQNVFAHPDDARAYIGRRLGLPYSSVAGHFDKLLALTLDRAVIENVLNEAI